MKRFIALLAMIMAMTSTCLAMTFSQPIKLGSVSDYGIVDIKRGYEFSGATYNKGGVAKFGDGEDAIYFHYNNTRNYGGKDLNNTFPFESAYGCDFTQIKTGSELTLYMIHEWEYDFTGEKYILLGMRKDGVWVKYFDTRNLTKIYFDKPKNRNEVPGYSKWYCVGDTIVVEYTRGPSKKEGEFRFKWDDAAQWFSVKQVVY